MPNETNITQTQPDFYNIAVTLAGGYSFGAKDGAVLPPRNVDTFEMCLRLLYNSPKALKASGLCKVDDVVPTKDAYEAACKALNNRHEELNNVKQQLKASDAAHIEACNENSILKQELKAEQAKVAALREKHAVCAAMRDRLIPWASDAQFSETNGVESRKAVQALIAEAELMKRSEEANNEVEAQV